MIQSSLFNVAIRIASVGLLLLLNIQLARALGPTGYGVLAFTLAWVQLLAILVQFGLPTALTRSVTLAMDSGQAEVLRDQIFSSFGLMGLIWCVVFAICSILWWFMGVPRGGVALAVPALLLVLVLALGPVLAGVLRGLGYVVVSQLPDQVVRPGLYCVALGLAILAGLALSPTSALWLQVGTASMAALVGTILLGRSLPTAGAPTSLQPFLQAQAATPFLLLSLVQGLSVHTAFLVLGRLSSDVELAHFRVAMQISDALNLFLLGISIVIGPMIARHHTRQDWAGLQHTVVWAHRAGFLLLLLPVIIFGIWAEPILTFVFGEDFAPAYQALRVLLVGKLLYALIGFSGLVLAMSGKPYSASLATVFSTIIIVISIFPSVIYFGLLGAATIQALGAILNALFCIALLPTTNRNISALACQRK